MFLLELFPTGIVILFVLFVHAVVHAVVTET